MNDEQLNRMEEKLDFLIFMHTKTVTQPPALAGQKPRVVILPGEMLFKQWQDANRKAGEEKGKQTPENPFKGRIPYENPMKSGCSHCGKPFHGQSECL